MTLQQVSFFPLGGGLDVTTPAIQLRPGYVISSVNYEPVAAGYRRLTGYERFSGEPAPSETRFWRLDFTNGGDGSSAPPANPTNGLFTDGTYDNHAMVWPSSWVITSGAWSSGTAAGYVIVYGLTGSLLGAVKTTAGGGGFSIMTVTTETADPDMNDGDIETAAELLRARIDAVPGEGDILGIWMFQDQILAFRNAVGGASARMYRAANGGWTQVTFRTRINFSSDSASGHVLPVAGQTISTTSGGSSVGTVELVKVTGLAGTVSTGYMIISGYTAGFSGVGTTIYRGAVAATFGVTTAGADTLTLSPGGRYQFVNHNFYGADDREAMYGVNGVNKAFQYDGENMIAIATGMDNDTPNKIEAHKNSLYLSFPGGSVQLSSVGEPVEWDPITGAAEISIGTSVTDMISDAGTLVILGEDSVHILYGSDGSDFQLEALTNEAGALEHTAQKIGGIVYMDNAGIRSLATSSRYGNFVVGSISQFIAPLIEAYRNAGINPVASFVRRRKNQYWLFFDNGTGLVIHMGRKVPEIMPVVLPITVTCACSVEVGGIERVFLGADDGYVYEMDKGYNFDGEAIEYHIRLPFNHLGAPMLKKRWHKVVIECDTGGESTIALSASADFDYGDTDNTNPSVATTVHGGGGLWDLSAWDDFVWSSPVEGQASAFLYGVGKNMSLMLAGSAEDEYPHTLSGVSVYFSVRGLAR